MALPGYIGRYQVLEFLGQGAMGVVYRGRDLNLERDVALKVMSGQHADADARARFRREALAAARLQHPNIVTIYELGEHEGQPFMALELLEGLDLQRAIEAGLRPDPRVTLPIVLQVLSGLGHAHDNDILHRDVKPSNVFLPRGRPAKIMDFGVARLMGGTATTGGVVGTPNYMSPEQVRGDTLDGRSDLFSAGLILYELVTGEKAYRGDSVVSLLYKIAHEPPNLSLIPKGKGWDHLRSVLETALAREVDERFRSAGAMADELAVVLSELGGSSNWSTASDRGLLARATPRPQAAPGSTPLPAPSLAPSGVSVAGASLAAGAGGAARQAGDLGRSSSALRSPWFAASAGALLMLAIGTASLVLLRRGGNGPAPQVPAGPATLAPAPTTTAPARLASPIPRSAAPTTAQPRPPSDSAAPVATASSPAPPIATGASPAAAVPTPALPVPGVPASTVPTPAATPVPEEVPAQVSEADARLERANTLYEQGRLAAALAESRAVLRREPRNAAAKTLVEDIEADLVVEDRLKKAREALRRGDKDAALEEIKAGLAVKPSDARLLALFREAVQ